MRCICLACDGNEGVEMIINFEPNASLGGRTRLQDYSIIAVGGGIVDLKRARQYAVFPGDMKQHEFPCILGFGKKAPDPPIPMAHGRFIRQV